MSFEKPPVPSNEAVEERENHEQSEREEKRIDRFFDHYVWKHPDLTDPQRAEVRTYMHENSSKAWGQYDDEDVRCSSILYERGRLVIHFDVMGNDVEEAIQL